MLEALQEHENNEVYQQVLQMIETYFNDVSVGTNVLFSLLRTSYSVISHVFILIFDLVYSFQNGEAENLAPRDVGGALEFNTNNSAPNNGFQF